MRHIASPSPILPALIRKRQVHRPVKSALKLRDLQKAGLHFDHDSLIRDKALQQKV